MFPKLYHSNETNFIHNGLGLLRDSITAVAIEELNGMFELQIEYDSEGFLVDEIKKEMIIKAKANDKQDEQLFRIYSITKNHENDNLIIDAQHITYDLANNFVEKMEARNVTKKQVMEQIGDSTAYPHPFNVTSSNNTTRSSTSLYRTNPLQMVAGMEGSVLQIWGGQIERDNFNLILHDRRGSDDGVKILYKKNLTGLEAKFDISQLKTRIFPFVYDEENNRLITVEGKYIDSPYINNYEMPYILEVDFADKFENIEEVTPQKLYNVAQNWFVETGRDKPKVEMEVKFEHLWETEEYKHLAVLELVGMGDIVTVEHSKLKVEAKAIVNRIEYDVIAEKNIAVDVGNVKARLTDSVNKVADVIEKVEHAEQTANQAIKAANGKNTNFYGPDEPTSGMIEGDIWFQTIDGQYTRTWRYDGIQWQLVLSIDTKDAYDEAQQAKDDAQQAVDRANQATQQATNAINQAQTAFDSAQDAISTADGAFNRANDAFNNVITLSSFVDENTGEISTIKHSVQGLQVQISDNEGNISNLTQIATGLQTRVSDAEGNISALQQTSKSFATRITDAEGNISTLTQTAQGLQTQINDKVSSSQFTQLAGVVDTKVTSSQVNALIASDRQIKDTRDTNEKPSYYFTNYKRQVVREFKRLTVMGISGNGSYGVLETEVPWNDKSGGQIKQTLYTDYATYERRGNNSNDTWNVWKKIADTDYVSSQITQTANSINQTIINTKDNLQSQITQLDRNINLRVQKGDVINQINISDESILIAGRRIHITGQTTIDNASIDGAKIKDASIGNAQIGSINAAKINSGELNTNNITIFGGNALDYTTIRGSYLESRGRFTRTWRGVTTTHDIKLRFQNGYLRARNDTLNRSLYFSDYGISTYVDGDGQEASGTLSFFNTDYSNPRGVSLQSGLGAVSLVSDQNRIVLDANATVNIESETASIYLRPFKMNRPGHNAFRFWIKDGEDASATDGVLTFGNVDVGQASGLRFQKSTVGTPVLWVTNGNGDIGTGRIRADRFIGDLATPASYAYVRAERLRVVQGSNNTNYSELQTGDILADSIRINRGKDFYIGTSTGEVRITNNLLYNGGNTGFRPIRALDFFGGGGGDTMFRSQLSAILESGSNEVYVRSNGELRVVKSGTWNTYIPARASSFPTGSLAEYKQDIREWEGSALDVIGNTTIYEYRLKNDPTKLRYGLVIGEGYNTPLEVIDGDGVEQYLMNSISWKAIQELSTLFNDHDDEINWLKLKVQYLEQKIKLMEAS